MVCKTQLRRALAVPGRAVREQQQLISPNHVQAILGCSVYVVTFKNAILDTYWARNKCLQNVISTTQAGPGRLV